jgi:hypothetical protein
MPRENHLPVASFTDVGCSFIAGFLKNSASTIDVELCALNRSPGSDLFMNVYCFMGSFVLTRCNE